MYIIIRKYISCGNEILEINQKTILVWFYPLLPALLLCYKLHPKALAPIP